MTSKTTTNIYNIGMLSANSTYKGGLVGWRGGTSSWSNYYWLEGRGANYAEGNSNNTYGIITDKKIKSLISDGGLPSTDWVISSNINNGYPHLKVFDNPSIWLRDNNINDGEPYLKDNIPQ